MSKDDISREGPNPNRIVRRLFGVAALALLVSCATAPLELPPGASLDEVVGAFVERGGLPSVAAAVVADGRLVYESAKGRRKLGDPTPVTVRDAYHIGSNTKSMTALLAATLVEQGLLRWDSTVGEVLGAEEAGRYGDVRLDELLSHTAGVPAAPSRTVWLGFFGTGNSAESERRRLAAVTLALPPAAAPGIEFLYSNMGYVVAGRMIEVATGSSWESLMRRRIFAPLGMEEAGFGPPASAGADPPDAPWGHSPAPVDPRNPYADNPPALGPAGTVHASLRDLERYAGFYLRGGTDAEGNRLIAPSTLRELYRPRLQGYALGWGVSDREGTPYLQHAGSNTTFVSSILVAPARKFAVIVMANRGDAAALDRVRQLSVLLRDRFDL